MAHLTAQSTRAQGLGNRWLIIARGASVVNLHQWDPLAEIGKMVGGDLDGGRLLQGATGVCLVH